MRILLHLTIVLVILLIPVASAMAEPGDESWSSAYHLPGQTGYLRSLTPAPEGLYVCGSINGLGETDARGIALVTHAGASWDVQGFGDDLFEAWGKPVHFDGRLTVSGRKVTDAGESIYGVYDYDGSRWFRLGTDPPHSFDLAVYQGRLISVSYLFSKNESTVWELEGDSWLPRLVTGGAAVHVIEHGGLLFVAGGFSSVNGDSVANIFAWDGTDVLELGGGFPHPVTALSVFDGDLVVTGAEGPNGGIISRWDGNTWTTLMDRNRLIESMTVLNGNLVAATDSLYNLPFSTGHVPDIMMYENGQWGSLTTTRGRHIAALDGALFLQNSDYFGIVEEDLVAPGLVIWTDGAFEAPFPHGMGFPDGRMSITLDQDNLLAGGKFRYGAGMMMEGAGSYDGSAWKALDSYDLGLSWYHDPRGFIDIVAVGNDIFGIYEVFELDFSFHILLKRDPDPPHDGVWRQLPGGTYYALERLQAVGDRLFTRLRDDVYEIDTETGTNFATAPAELDGYILASCAIDSRLVIAGGFTTLNGEPSANILRYEDTHWAQHAPALPGPVTAVASLPDGRLAAAYQAGNAHRIAVFDGTVWVYHQGDFDGPVQAITWHQDRLVVAGCFTYVDGMHASGIAVWTGGRWGRLGSGLAGWVSNARIVDLVSTDHGLYVSGGMTTAGGHRTSGVAVWTGDLRLISGISPVTEDLPAHTDPFGLRAYPNPFNPRTVISWVLPTAGPLNVAIHDMRGRKVRTLLAGHRPAGPDEAIWNGLLDNGQPAPSGIYHLRLVWNGQAASRKLTLVR